MASWLAAQGYEVRVVTAPPYYPTWTVGAGYSARAWKHEHWQGLSVWRCPLWVPRRPGGVKRLIHLASFALSSLPLMLGQVFWRPDVVWVVEPPLFCAPTAWAVARLAGARAWLHIQDYEVDAAFDLGLLKGAWLKRMVTAGERWLMRRFDVVSTISQRMLARALAKELDAKRAAQLPNWVDVKAFSLATADGVRAYRTELGLPTNAVVALYSGNMGAKQGLELLAETARLCEHHCCFPEAVPDVAKVFAEYADSTPPGIPRSGEEGVGKCVVQSAPRLEKEGIESDLYDEQKIAHKISDAGLGRLFFVFCGNGVGRDDLVAHCSGLANVRFLNLQPAERLPDLLGMADIHLLPQRADAADLVMPSKLTGMLASARPVVATAHPGTELAQVVNGCGVVVPPEDPRAMADAVLKLAADAAYRRELGEAGRRHAVEHMDRESVLKRFEVALKELIQAQAA